MRHPRTVLSAGGALGTFVVAGVVWILSGSMLGFMAIPLVAFLLPIFWSHSGGRQRMEGQTETGPGRDLSSEDGSSSHEENP